MVEQHILIENQNLDDLNPLVCGEQQCEPGHSFGPAVRDYFLLHYVQSGKGEMRNPRGIYPVTAGSIFIIRPDEVCLYTADRKHPWHYYWVGFSTRLPVDMLLPQDVFPAIGVAHIFHELADCSELHGGREWMLCAKIYELLALLREQAESPAGRTLQYVGMARNYIQTGYMLELHVAQIASYLHLDRSYFSHIFKKHTGVSPQQYIIDYRLKKAAELLARGMRPGEAATMVGYPDIVNFSRMFKRKYGIAPSHYHTDTAAQRGTPL